MSESSRTNQKLNTKHKSFTAFIPSTTVELLDQVYTEINQQNPFTTVNKRLVINHILKLGIKQWHKENDPA